MIPCVHTQGIFCSFILDCVYVSFQPASLSQSHLVYILNLNVSCCFHRILMLTFWITAIMQYLYYNSEREASSNVQTFTFIYKAVSFTPCHYLFCFSVQIQSIFIVFFLPPKWKRNMTCILHGEFLLLLCKGLCFAGDIQH